MKKSGDDASEAIAKQYRDWLIPATLLVGVDAGILMLAVQIEGSSKRLIAAGILAISSIVLFLLSLFWAVTRLESIEVYGRSSREGGPMYVLSCCGVATLLASLVILSFVKSAVLGIGSLLIVLAGVLALLLLLRHEDKSY